MPTVSGDHDPKSVLLMSRHAGRRSALAALLLACLWPPCGAAADGDAAPADDAIDEVTVFGERLPEKSPFGFTLEAEDLTNMAGIQNDPIKAVVALPGVLTNDDFDTGVALRGTRPNDNRYYLDFLPTGDQKVQLAVAADRSAQQGSVEQVLSGAILQGVRSHNVGDTSARVFAISRSNGVCPSRALCGR